MAVAISPGERDFAGGPGPETFLGITSPLGLWSLVKDYHGGQGHMGGSER